MATVTQHARRAWVPDAAIASAWTLIAVLWSRKVVAFWWTFDDPFHLNLIAHRGAADLLFDSAFWRAFPSHVFTPLLLLSLQADLRLFGLEARPFYIHQIAIFACIAPALYLLLRQWVSRGAAACAVLIAIAGAPMIESVQRLMDRHYLEGLLLAILAAFAYVVAVRRSSAPIDVLSGVLYLLSMAAKEIFVPLIVILPVIPGVPPRRRLRTLVPHAIALLFYCIWRFAVLGVRVESYGWAVKRSDWLRLIAMLPLRIGAVLAGSAPVGVAAVLLMLVALVIVAVRRPGSRPVLGTGVIAAFLPILPVSFEIHPRYALTSWILAAVAVAFLGPSRWERALQVAIVIAVAVSARQQWSESDRSMRRMSDEARVFAALGPDDVLWMPATPPATLDELSRMTGSRGRWTYDALPFCRQRLTAKRFFAYDPATRRVQEASPDQLRGACKASRAAPLSVRFDFQQGSLFWVFGPYDSGTYRVIIADGRQGFDVPRRAGFQLAGVATLPLRVRYESPAGWVTYSDDLQVVLKDGQTVTWRR